MEWDVKAPAGRIPRTPRALSRDARATRLGAPRRHPTPAPHAGAPRPYCACVRGARGRAVPARQGALLVPVRGAARTARESDGACRVWRGHGDPQGGREG
eukprot:4118026-Prymnesium_polylepis.1